jgi:hypothetical protein
VAGILVRNPQLVAWASHYSVVVHTCEPADPASNGGTEASVKIAKADPVPKDTNLREAYASFAELEAACEAFTEEVNARPHRVTRRPPVEMLAEERARLHPVPVSHTWSRSAPPGWCHPTRRWSDRYRPRDREARGGAQSHVGGAGYRIVPSPVLQRTCSVWRRG